MVGTRIVRSTAYPCAGRVAFPVTSNPFAFTDVPATLSNLLLWLRADQRVTLSGSNVTSWRSLEGDNYAFSQGTASKQPTYQASSSIGSKPAIELDGGDFLAHTASLFNNTTGTLFVVARMASFGPHLFPIFISSYRETPDNDGFVSFYGYGNGAHPKMGFSQKNDDVEDALKGSTTTAINTNYLYIYATDGATTTMELNGVTQTVAPFSGSNNGDWFGDSTGRDNTMIGCRRLSVGNELNFFDGQIAELIHYADNKSSADRTTIKNYINARYGI